MVVWIELCFLPRMQSIFDHIFLLLHIEVSSRVRKYCSGVARVTFARFLCLRQMVRYRSGLLCAFFSRCRFSRMEVNIPGVIHGLRCALSYTFLV